MPSWSRCRPSSHSVSDSRPTVLSAGHGGASVFCETRKETGGEKRDRKGSHLRHWLQAPGSLTAHLEKTFGPIQVRRIRQSPGHPRPDEARALGWSGTVLIREVALYHGNTPLVVARSLTPIDSVRGPWLPLQSLGKRPLAQLLFQHPAIHRSGLEFLHCSRCFQNHPLLRLANSHFKAGGQSLWARRSRFIKNGRPLLVCEAFNPLLDHKLLTTEQCLRFHVSLQPAR